ncbi:MAG: hypothetical protein NC314_14055 [Roseburia sp.]|nr:hypothetical protein [Roseburia sp.]MCM1243963.1 hypothetical protein [Roseburia sp.]
MNEMAMEKMKQEVQEKLKYWGRICALFTILMSLNVWEQFKPMNGGEAFDDFFHGFCLGLAIVFMLFAIKNIATYRKILNDEEALRAFYIKKHDERQAAIEAKAGGTALYTCGVLIIGASIVAAFFDVTVFATLLSCGTFLLLVKKCLRIYYCKKM